MLTARLPLVGDQNKRSRTGRKPLQPTNPPANLPINNHQNLKIKKSDWIEISLVNNSNKENPHRPIYQATMTEMESIDLSLAEELSAFREKLERLRLEKEKTEKMMRERDLVLERKMEEMLDRGEIQKHLEIEVDRLFRLKEIKSQCKRKSTVRSLREKEQEGKIKEEQPQGTNSEGSTSEYKEGSQLQSPISDIHTGK